MNKQMKTVMIVILAAILVGSGVFVGINWNHWFEDKPVTTEIDEGAENYTGNKETYTGKKNTETIDIPGFDMMNIQAGVKEQKVNLYNPEQNTCYFKMSIFLEDGTKLWESKLIEPGKAVYDITLNQTLGAGAYENSILKYECFAMNEEQTPLNGSEIKFTLNVLE